MGLKTDLITLLSLTNASAGGNGSSFDLSGYNGGSLYINTTAFTGTSWTPLLETTLDGTNWTSAALSVNYLPAIAAITTTGPVWVPLSRIPIGKVRINYSGTFTVLTATIAALMSLS